MSIRIERYSPADAPALVGAARESVAEVRPWLAWCHPGFSESDATEWLTAQVEAWDGGSAFEFGIRDETGRLLGGCGINRVDSQHRFANLGYWVRTAATGQGVATTAVRQLIRHAEEETGLVRLEIVAALGNRASRRVAEKVGARFEGTLANRLYLHGQAVDAALYAIAIDR